ncbi:MAG: HAD family hydrolase [Dehalococcoidia bacterium]
MRLLLFDVDLTLIRTGGAGRVAMRRAFRRVYGDAAALDGIHFDGRTDRAIFNEAIARQGAAGNEVPRAYELVTAAYLDELPRGLCDTEGVVLPGVNELLRILATRPAVTGLATGNFRRGAELKLGHYGLWDKFAGGGFGDDSEVRAEVVLAAIHALGAVAATSVAPADAVVIGDTPHDVDAALAVGARAVAVATGSFTVEELRAAGAHLVLPDFADAAAAADLLLA